MEFIYNNISYWISKDESLESLIKRNDFIKLDLSTWINLLNFRFGTFSTYDLYKVLVEKIMQLDKSQKINSFYIADYPQWFDKNTRLGLMHLANCSENNVDVVFTNKIINVTTQNLKKFLQQVEVYAGQCYVQTQKHLQAIKQLKTVEDILNYDYTQGYPNKLKFDENLDLATV